MDLNLGKKIIALKQRIEANFNSSHWEEVGLLTGESDTINGYPRLLRSLSFGDEDYAGNILGVLKLLAERKPKAFAILEQYVDEKFPGDSEYISAKPAERRITFAPHVFTVPELSREDDLAAVMMPLSAEFKSV